MTRPPVGIIDALKEPDLFDDLHQIAERQRHIYVVHHALIKQLARRAFGTTGEWYASFGVGVHEVVSDFSELETPHPEVLGRTNTLDLLAGTDERVSDVILDVTNGFRRVEPTMFEVVNDIVTVYAEQPSSRNLALFGAALSYTMLFTHESAE